jgi:hypothetical protein
MVGSSSAALENSGKLSSLIVTAAQMVAIKARIYKILNFVVLVKIIIFTWGVAPDINHTPCMATVILIRVYQGVLYTENPLLYYHSMGF